MISILGVDRMLPARSACPRKSKHEEDVRFSNPFLPVDLLE